MPRPKLARPQYRLKLRGRIWSLTWTDPESGATRAVSTGEESLREAEIWRDQWLAGQEQPEPPQQPMISGILDGYLAGRKGRVAAYARLDYAAQAIRRHVGNLEPHMLTPESYVEKRKQEGVGDGTVRREVNVLRAALAWATRQQPPWIDRAPYLEMPSAPPPRERWLTREEVERLIAGCGRAHVRLFVLLAYHTAARAGAILELTWDRVDLEHRRIDYRRPGRAETRKRRATVALNRVVLAALQEARLMAIDRLAETMPGARSDELLAELVRHPVIEHHGKGLASIKKGFAAACKRAGIEDCSPHSLRHTAATHMVEANVPLSEIARMLGDSEAMVERVYGKHSPDYLRRAADALAGDSGPRLVKQRDSDYG
jgi:integrase